MLQDIYAHFTWWHHQVETFSALLALVWGILWNPPVTGGFPSQRPVTRCFDVFFIFAWTNGRANNRETCDLKRHCAHCDVTVIYSTRHSPSEKSAFYIHKYISVTHGLKQCYWKTRLWNIPHDKNVIDLTNNQYGAKPVYLRLYSTTEPTPADASTVVSSLWQVYRGPFTDMN